MFRYWRLCFLHSSCLLDNLLWSIKTTSLARTGGGTNLVDTALHTLSTSVLSANTTCSTPSFIAQHQQRCRQELYPPMQNIIFNIEQVRVADRILGLQQTRQLFTDVNISWPIAAQALLTQQRHPDGFRFLRLGDRQQLQQVM